jgi:hypothetical protein
MKILWLQTSDRLAEEILLVTSSILQDSHLPFPPHKEIQLDLPLVFEVGEEPRKSVANWFLGEHASNSTLCPS